MTQLVARPAHDGQRCPRNPETLGEGLLELGRLADAGGPLQGRALVHHVLLRPVVPDRLRDEAGAALGTTAGQHQTAALGGHAGAEAVGALAPQGVRLECTFHDCLLERDKRALFYRLIGAPGKIGAIAGDPTRLRSVCKGCYSAHSTAVDKSLATG